MRAVCGRLVGQVALDRGDVGDFAVNELHGDSVFKRDAHGYHFPVAEGFLLSFEDFPHEIYSNDSPGWQKHLG